MRLNPRKRQDVARMETIDMTGNINDFINLVQQMNASGNPAQFISQRFNVNIPDNIKDSNGAIQFFLNNGRFTQEQVNRAMTVPNSIQSMFQKMFTGR